MAGAIRLYSSAWLTGGLHFIILAVALQAESAAVWPYALGAMAAVSLCAWIANHRRYRQIHDLPTSRVGSAAQGYVELFGRSEQLPESQLTSPLNGLTCCWYRYQVERRTSNNKWVNEENRVSGHPLLLVDDTGQCVIFPDRAEVVCVSKETWREGDYRYTQWLMLPGGPLYAIGEFSTQGGAHSDLNDRQAIGELLAEWKREQQNLLQRFDLDGDGKLDLREWELARLQAQREVRRRHQEIRSEAGVHVLRRPGSGGLFLLSNQLPDKLGRRYAFWSWLHLVVFFGAGGGATMLWLA